MIDIMLVEDHDLFRQALTIFFDDEPDLRVIAQAGSLAESRERAAALVGLIRVAVVDFALPDGDATDLIRELRRSSPGVKILVFTASVDPETERRALEAGADAILRKTAHKDEILASVRGLVED